MCLPYIWDKIIVSFFAPNCRILLLIYYFIKHYFLLIALSFVSFLCITPCNDCLTSWFLSEILVTNLAILYSKQTMENFVKNKYLLAFDMCLHHLKATRGMGRKKGDTTLLVHQVKAPSFIVDSGLLIHFCFFMLCFLVISCSLFCVCVYISLFLSLPFNLSWLSLLLLAVYSYQ